jgi:hypothetical protein
MTFSFSELELSSLSASELKVQRVDSVFDEFPQILIHAVNSQAVCKNRYSVELSRNFPAYFKEYKRRALRGSLQVGERFVFETSELFGVQKIWEVCCRESWKMPFCKILFLQEVQMILNSVPKNSLFENLKTLRIGLPSFESWNWKDMCKDLESLLDKPELSNIHLVVQIEPSNGL